MSESMKSLYRRGMISGKQMGRMAKPAILAKTKPGVPTKMADFDGKAGKRDQGGVRDRGEVPGNEINHPTNQAKKPVGTVSKGGGVNKGGQPTARAIDQDQKPSFPKGALVSGKEAGRKVGVGGPKGKSAPSQYGGPSSRAYG
jgi:hypothetical protein